MGSQLSSPVRLCKTEKQIYAGRDEGSADNYILSIGCRSEGSAGHLTVSVLPFAEGFSACPIIHTEGTHLDAFKGIRCMFLRACSYKTTADALLSVLFGMESLVPCNIYRFGYRRFSLIRASAVMNCQSIFVWRLFRSFSQAAIAAFSFGKSAIRRSCSWHDYLVLLLQVKDSPP